MAINSFLQEGHTISVDVFLLHLLHNFPAVNGFMKYCFACIVRRTEHTGYAEQRKVSTMKPGFYYFLQLLFCSRMNISRAIIIEGASGLGA